MGVPLAEDKTVLPVEILTFLGIEFDTFAMELWRPKVKLIEIKQRITVILGGKKAKLRELQSLIELLNLACQVVVPGRAFCRRLIDPTCNLKEAWHRIRVSSEMQDDLQMSRLALQTVSTTSRQGTYSNAKPTMEILDVEVEKLVHFSMAKNTWKTYKTALVASKV
ncbi:unnamed protein product [Mytilus edulis]|uniref:Uncharacterized protein n=1 Tax=Mytilus edulis TaxID=6550 RepID=A0A8S3UXJ2_MYTED|nr:unnamed protein product [Mytilus edulis]